MALRKKLYYRILIDTTQGEGAVISIDGAPPTLISPVAIRFTTSSGRYGNNADPDRYGNLLEPNQYAGAVGSGARTRQAIGGWFVPSLFAPLATPPLLRPYPLAIDFIAETGAVGAAAAIDPATVRRPRARARFVGADLAAGSTISGTLYIQRQHSIEV
jgi:hypothetical protein